MIRLDKYNEFLDAFKYAKFGEIEDSYIKLVDDGYELGNNEPESKEEKDFFQMTCDAVALFCQPRKTVEFNMSESELEDLTTISKNINTLISQAESEFINNIFQLTSKDEKKEFIHYMINKFLPTYQHTIEAHCQSKYRGVTISMEDVSWKVPYLFEFDHYIKETCFNGLKKWIQVLNNLAISSNLTLQITSHLREIEVGFDDYLNLFKQLFRPNEFPSKATLKSFFIVPDKYDIIMRLPNMINYLSRYGGDIQNAPKCDQAAFLITLLNNGYFPFTLKRELKQVARDVYGISRVMDDANDKQPLYLFSFLPIATALG